MRPDCFTCQYASRDKHNRYIDRCSGYGNCDYEPFDMSLVKETLSQYINRMRDKYSYNNTEITKIYDSNYITGVRDALSFVEYFMDNE